MPSALDCAVCGQDTSALGTLQSDFSGRDFHLRRCASCGFGHISNPRVDFAQLYGADYYAGRGADPLVDYITEMEDPNTIRRYEWRGIQRAVSHLAGTEKLDWLDYGCGLGGLVRHVRSNADVNIFGFEQGFAADWMRRHGLPVLTAAELKQREGTFHVVTAIEVIEHVNDPIALLSQIALLLAPGGLFFLTTGNAEPHRDHLARWSYVKPDIHVAYFEPRTLREAYRRTGLEPLEVGFVPGHEDIIRYKVLKTLRVPRRNLVERLVPWRLASLLVDHRHRVTALPLARRPLS